MSAWAPLLSLVVATASTTATSTTTEQREREDAMFGPGPAGGEAEERQTREDAMFGAGPSSAGAPEGGEREDAMFGAPGAEPAAKDPMSFDDGALSATERLLAATDDILEIGGRLFLRLNGQTLDGPDPEALGSPAPDATRFSISSPSLLDVYLDARPNERVRAYARGRLVYDPTIDSSSPNLFGQTQDKLQVRLDQIFVKFDIARTLYVTAGRQQIKWGSGIIWNPSDFVNDSVRNPLTVFDERLGADIIKLHAPFESIDANLYAIAILRDANQAKKIAAALRAELVVGPSELSVSALLADGAPTRIAADISAGLWMFDVRVESALQFGSQRPFYRRNGDANPFDSVEVIDRSDDVILQVLASAETSIKYSDQDSLVVGFEYLFNDAGYDDPALYAYLLSQGQFVPLFTGRHYAGLYVVASNPGSWNNSTFSLFGIGNLSDRSFNTRLNYSLRFLTYLSFNAFLTHSFGDNGELHLSFDVPPGSITALPQGLSQAAPFLGMGMGLTATW